MSLTRLPMKVGVASGNEDKSPCIWHSGRFKHTLTHSHSHARRRTHAQTQRERERERERERVCGINVTMRRCTDVFVCRVWEKHWRDYFCHPAPFSTLCLCKGLRAFTHRRLKITIIIIYYYLSPSPPPLSPTVLTWVQCEIWEKFWIYIGWLWCLFVQKWPRTVDRTPKFNYWLFSSFKIPRRSWEYWTLTFLLSRWLCLSLFFSAAVLSLCLSPNDKWNGKR